MEKKSDPRTKADHRKVEEMVHANELPQTDPFGSYTGKPENPDEVPVQDADDL